MRQRCYVLVLSLLYVVVHSCEITSSDVKAKPLNLIMLNNNNNDATDRRHVCVCARVSAPFELAKIMPDLK